MHICGSNYQLFGLNLIYSDCYIERNVRKMQGKMWISRKFLRQRLIKNNAEKKGVLRSPIFPNGAHLARIFEKMSGALLALARKRAALTHAMEYRICTYKFSFCQSVSSCEDSQPYENQLTRLQYPRHAPTVKLKKI